MEYKILLLSLTVFAVPACDEASSSSPDPSIDYGKADRGSSCRLDDGIRSADSRDEIHDRLDETSPRFWSDLTGTGRDEAVDAIWIGLDDGEFDCTNGRTIVDRALQFAAVNDAVYDRVSVASMVDILNPGLRADLGYGSEHPVEAVVAEVILEGGTNEDDTFGSLDEYEERYWDTVRDHWSGR